MDLLFRSRGTRLWVGLLIAALLLAGCSSAADVDGGRDEPAPPPASPQGTRERGAGEARPAAAQAVAKEAPIEDGGDAGTQAADDPATAQDVAAKGPDEDNIALDAEPSTEQPPQDPSSPPRAVEPPRPVAFAPGEPVDVQPAVLFAAIDGTGVRGWQFPEYADPHFVVAPAGNFIVWTASLDDGSQEVRLFHTVTGEDRVLTPGGNFQGSRVIAIAPDSSGFVLLGDVVRVYDEFGTVSDTLTWRAVDSLPWDVEWSVTDPLGETWLAWSHFDADATQVLVALADDLSEPSVVLTLTDPALALGSQFPRLGLAWGPEGKRLAVGTAGALRLVDRAAGVLWAVADPMIRGNPRWNADGLISIVLEGRTTRYYSAEGEFVREAALYACGGPTLPLRLAGGRRVGLRGGEVLVLGPGDEEQVIARSLPSVGFHGVHYGPEVGRVSVTATSDGLWAIFTSPGIGHGGCGS